MKMRMWIVSALLAAAALAPAWVEADSGQQAFSGAGSPKASSSRYMINGGEVYDKQTDLTWQRCSVGQRWKEDIGCAGVIKTFAWKKAQQQGSGSWRVPTKDELATLIDHGRDRWPTIDIETFPDMDGTSPRYWSSNQCWAVDFRVGSVDAYYDYGYGFSCGYGGFAVRLVRGGQ